MAIIPKSWAGGSGGEESSLPIEYDYTGSSKISYSAYIDADNIPRIEWQLSLLTSGTLKIKRLVSPIHDAFLVGGGGGGGGCFTWGDTLTGPGGGGGSGRVLTASNVDLQCNIDYPVIIGAGGSGGASGDRVYDGSTGGTTSILGYAAAGGSGGGQGGVLHTDVSSYPKQGPGGAGGSGGGGGGGGAKGGAGSGTTTKAFGTGALYAAGGGGGTQIYLGDSYTAGGAGGTNGANGKDGATKSASTVTHATKGTPGPANTGNGGGGAGYPYTTSGAGGSGIVILRGRYA